MLHEVINLNLQYSANCFWRTSLKLVSRRMAALVMIKCYTFFALLLFNAVRLYQLSEAKWLCGKFQNVGERYRMVSRLLLFGEISRFREVSRGDKQQIR